MAREWRRLTNLGIPHVQDVGAPPVDEHLFDGAWEPIWFIGSDGSLWRLEIPFSSQCKQVSSPGDLTRIAVEPGGTLWCVDTRGALWRMQGGTWSQVPVSNQTVVDVSVAPD